MANARRRGFAKKMDSTRWLKGNASFGALAAGSVAATIVGAFSTVTETLLRMRGEVLVYLDGTSEPGVLVLVSMGIRLVQAGQGTTVVSNPFDDAQASWLWYESVSLAYQESVTNVIAIDGISSARINIDNKAMRIIRPDTELQLIVTNSTVLTAEAVNVSFFSRFLLGH